MFLIRIVVELLEPTFVVGKPMVPLTATSTNEESTRTSYTKFAVIPCPARLTFFTYLPFAVDGFAFTTASSSERVFSRSLSASNETLPTAT